MKNFRFLPLFLPLFLPFLLLLSAPAPAWAGAQQSHAEIKDAITAFVTKETRSLPGKVTIKVSEIDPLTTRPACPKLEVFLPAGAQLLGNSTMGARCAEKNWTLFVPVTVRVSVDQLIANKPLNQGQALRAEDLSLQNGELAQTDVLTDPAEAIGKIVKIGVGAGQVLRRDMLRPPDIIKQGQTVHLLVEGAGFNIRSEGQALNDAAQGQTVQVKTSSGQRVSGKAQPDGSVTISP
jgi:flagella basal body P-ring formation protein FlgA